MFCRFCGKAIQENSEFCPYCGKAQGATTKHPTPKRPAPTIKFPKFDGIDIFTLEIIASICFYVGIIGFLILFMKMAPGIGGNKFIAYIIGAAITIVAAVIVHKIRNKEFTKKRQLVALVFGLLLLIPSITLRIVYECKVDAAVADIPKSGTVCIEIDTDAEFYSFYGEGLIRNPYSKISFDGHSANTLYVDLNKPYTAKISAGHEGRSGVASSSASGSKEKTVTFTQANLRNGYTFNENVSISGGHANVTVKIKRICTFWDVIFYSPA